MRGDVPSTTPSSSGSDSAYFAQSSRLGYDTLLHPMRRSFATFYMSYSVPEYRLPQCELLARHALSARMCGESPDAPESLAGV